MVLSVERRKRAMAKRGLDALYRAHAAEARGS